MIRASAIERNGRVVCFVGLDDTAKKTALVSCLTANMPGLRTVGADRLLIHGLDRLEVVAWPGEERSVGELVREPSEVFLAAEYLGRENVSRFSSGGSLSAVLEVCVSSDLKSSEIEVIDDQDHKVEFLQRHRFDVPADHPGWLGVERLEVPYVSAAVDEWDLTKVYCARITLGEDQQDVLRGVTYTLTSGDALTSGLSSCCALLPKYHFGVYARIRQGDEVLLVRKSRGPYTGLLDLPGGRPEVGESMETALARELVEELGVSLSITVDFELVSVHVGEDSDGLVINFIHEGLVADVPLGPNDLRNGVMSEDTSGFEWVPLASLTAKNASSFAREALGL